MCIKMAPADRCLLTDLRTGVFLFASYQSAVGTLLLIYALYLVVASFYWGLMPSAVLYLLVGSVGLAATTDRHAVLYYAPAVIRSADIYFALTAGMLIADAFISMWQIAYVATTYSNCTSTLRASACEAELYTLIVIVVWKCLTTLILCGATYFTWSYKMRLRAFKPVMTGQEHIEAPRFMFAPIPQPNQPFNPYYPPPGAYFPPGYQPGAAPPPPPAPGATPHPQPAGSTYAPDAAPTQQAAPERAEASGGGGAGGEADNNV